MVGKWVVEGGGGAGESGGIGGGGLHSSNGMREPLSNRCRGGARSPRWLLRTLMSFSLGPPPATRPASHPLGGPRVVLLHLRRRATRRHVAAAAATAATVPSRFLSLIPRLLTAADVLLSLSFLSFSPAPGEAAMTRVNLPQTPDRYRRTSASLSALLRLFLRPTADNCHPPRLTPLFPSPALPLHPSVASAHPATNLLRMLALYARLALNV